MIILKLKIGTKDMDASQQNEAIDDVRRISDLTTKEHPEILAIIACTDVFSGFDVELLYPKTVIISRDEEVLNLKQDEAIGRAKVKHLLEEYDKLLGSLKKKH